MTHRKEPRNDGRKLLSDTKSQLESVLAEIEKNEEALSEQRSGLDKAEDKRKEIADRIQRNNMDVLTVNGDISNIRTRIEGIDASILALERRRKRTAQKN